MSDPQPAPRPMDDSDREMNRLQQAQPPMRERGEIEALLSRLPEFMEQRGGNPLIRLLCVSMVGAALMWVLGETSTDKFVGLFRK